MPRSISRRRFLQGVAAAVVSPALPACISQSQWTATTTMSPPGTTPSRVASAAPSSLSATAPSIVPLPPLQPAACFPESGKCAQGLFYAYWMAHDGPEQFGYPISDEFDEAVKADGKRLRVQYYERARLEYHQEHVNTPFVVLAGLLGTEQFRSRYPQSVHVAPEGSPSPGPQSAPEHCFQSTGHCLRGAFARYWQQHGDPEQFGYPISDEFNEVNSTDGKPYRAQYCERARLEYRPENAGTDHEVLLGRLGTEQFAARYPNGQPPAAAGPAINVWAATTSGMAPQVAGLPPRVYVPNERGGDVAVIDPASFQVIDRFRVGQLSHHVTPAYDLTRLYVTVMETNRLVEIDPRNGKPAGTIPLPAPYNLYFTTDGR